MLKVQTTSSSTRHLSRNHNYRDEWQQKGFCMHRQRLFPCPISFWQAIQLSPALIGFIWFCHLIFTCFHWGLSISQIITAGGHIPTHPLTTHPHAFPQYIRDWVMSMNTKSCRKHLLHYNQEIRTDKQGDCKRNIIKLLPICLCACMFCLCFI